MADNHSFENEALDGNAETNEYIQQVSQYIHQGNFYKANDALQDAIWKSPNSGKLRYIQGLCRVEVGDQEGAVNAFDRAIALSYNPVSLHISRITSLISLGRYEAALLNCDTILEIDAQQLQIINLKALALEHLGRLDEAREYFERILELAPGDPSALYNLSKQGISKQIYSEWCDPGHSIHADRVLGWQDISYLHFAKARYEASCKDYDAAFALYQKGNSAVRNAMPYDKKAMNQRADDHINAFQKSVFEQFSGCGSSTDQPIFIVGMPRSGTTLIEQMISSHKDVQAAGEITYIHRIEGQLIDMSGAEGEGYPSNISLIQPGGFKKFSELYLSSVSQIAAKQKRYFTDKLPTNFLNLGLIRLMFPNAKIIHMTRNPLDTCLSCYFIRFTDVRNLSFSYDLESLGHFYVQYHKLMQHWKEVLPGPMMDVCYEELVKDNEAVLGKVLDFIGLDWDQNCLEFYNNERGVATASRYQVRKPVYTSSIGRWKTYESHLQPLIQILSDEELIAS